MPSDYTHLRQYSSLQAMRHVEGSNVPIDLEILHNQAAATDDIDGLSVGVRDFQDTLQTMPSRRPSTPRPETTSPKASVSGAPPLPNFHQHLRHLPLGIRLELLCVSVETLDADSHDEISQGNIHSLTTASEHVRSHATSTVSTSSSNDTYETHATSLELPALQARTAVELSDQMRPLSGELPGSFDLVAPAENSHRVFSLEARSEQLFSHEHLKVIFSDPSLLLRFTAFLSTYRPHSIPILIYYLDALKAMKAINYANAIAKSLRPISGLDFTRIPAEPTTNATLGKNAREAFDVLVKEDLPAYITHMYIQIVSLSISRRITGTLAAHLQEASEGLAEVFCLTDPSRPDNPIVFTSEGKC